MKKQHLVKAFTVLICFMPAASAGPVAFQQAVADYNAGKYSQALAEFESYKAAYPTNALTRYYIALCRQALGHINQAKQEYEWVSANGDPSLKALAAQGLQRLGGVKMSGTGSSTPTSTAAPSAGATVTAKVKKIIEFYADW
ncbi:MAG TPA: hypothetical protein V6D17_23105 [Candidatus Obscuribacterales bacterium]